MNDNPFWKFENSCKWDVLVDRNPRHYRLILRALRDRHTGIERSGKDWLIYGDEEALLIEQPSSPIVRAGLYVYFGLCLLLRKNND